MREYEEISYEERLELAAKVGDIRIVELMIEKGANHFNMATALASKGGHVNVVRLMIEKYNADDFNWVMRSAAMRK